MLTETRTETWCEVTEHSVDLHQRGLGPVGPNVAVGDRYQAENTVCLLGDRSFEVRETSFGTTATWVGVGLGAVLVLAAVLAIVIGAVSVVRGDRSGDRPSRRERRKRKKDLIDERFTSSGR